METFIAVFKVIKSVKLKYSHELSYIASTARKEEEKIKLKFQF